MVPTSVTSNKNGKPNEPAKRKEKKKPGGHKLHQRQNVTGGCPESGQNLFNLLPRRFGVFPKFQGGDCFPNARLKGKNWEAVWP